MSFLSPCILPLLPAYLTYLGGASELALAGRWTLLARAAAFVAGFSVIFVALGLISGGLGSILVNYREPLQKAAGLLIIVLGLQTAGVIKLGWLLRSSQRRLPTRAPSLAASFLLGLSFGTAWTPCVGPVLASILAYAAGQGTAASGALLLFVYSLGLGLPFLALALALNRAQRLIRRLARYLPAISLASGLALVFLGILVFYNHFGDLGGLI